MKRSSSNLTTAEYHGAKKSPRLEETECTQCDQIAPLPKHKRSSSLNYVHNHKCKHKHCCPDTLANLSAKVAAASIPFELVEERYPRVPEPVVRKLIMWSFPRSEEDVRRYSAIIYEPPAIGGAKSGGDFRYILPENVEESENQSHSSSSEKSSANGNLNGQDITFRQGASLADGGSIHKPMQIGFHLSGVVHEKINDSNSSCGFSSSSRTYDVAVTFDRCKVTSSTCNCRHGDGIFFCRHIVAILLYRMRHPSKVKIRAPISDSLQLLSRDQLQKLIQYMLARHGQVLPTAQEITDSFCDPGSSINVVHGAPDPTAGAGYQDDDRWSLDDSHVSKHIRSLLLHSSKHSSAQQLKNMMKKVREMLKVRDCNGSRLLTLITTQLLQHGYQLRTQQSSKIFTHLWDDIGLLWICVVLNPDGEQGRSKILNRLRDWNSDSRCPPEDDDTDFNSSTSSGRTVFSRAIDSGSLTWDDHHLNAILRPKNGRHTFPHSNYKSDTTPTAAVGGLANFNSKGQPLWHEDTPTACVRVETLRCHGYQLEAVRLAVAIARTIKENAIGQFRLYHRKHANQQDTSIPDRNPGVGLAGHPLNPILILIDTLTTTYDVSLQEVLKNEDQCTRGSLRRDAFEICLLSIGEQRCMPQSSRAQEKVLSYEKQLIEKIEKLSPDDTLVRSLRKITILLLEGGPRSSLGAHVHRDSLPMHTFARYLFNVLLPHDRKLAFRIGLRAMRMRILDSHDDVTLNRVSNHEDNNNLSAASGDDEPGPQNGRDTEHVPFQLSYPTTWTVMGDLEAQQYELASVMTQTAKGDLVLLREIVESIQRHVRNANHVFQLSHDAFKNATASQSVAAASDSLMLDVAMQLAMQVLRMTLHGPTWRRSEMVGWLITCANEIGLCALVSIIKTWYTLFTPVEACTVVAGYVISPNTAMRLNLDPRQRDELYQNVCQMAVQCAVKDPQSCALCSLTLSETFTSAFDNVYHVIRDASKNKRIDSVQLYATARYLEQRGLHGRAFDLALDATKRLRVPFNQDGHPAANDILWTTQLAQSLNVQKLEELIQIIVSKVRSASVLSDMLRICTSSISGRMCVGNYRNGGLPAHHPPLLPLLEASMSAYVNTIHSKLSHISPRHYTEFIVFLNKARDTFLLAPDGHVQFSHLLANLKIIYKGKKKLLNLVSLRFG